MLKVYAGIVPLLTDLAATNEQRRMFPVL